jgi:hypothetical protein
LILRGMLAVFCVLVAADAHAACPVPFAVRDGLGATQSMEAVNDASNNCEFVNTIGDGGGAANRAAVKAASTAPTATDPALVVSLSPNGTVNPGCAGQTIGNTLIAQVNLTASGRIITGVSAKKVFVCAIDISVSAADNVALVEGTGSTCGTSTAGMNGGSTAATGWNFAANTGLTKGNGQGLLTVTATAADDVCLLVSSGAQVSGVVTYAQF